MPDSAFIPVTPTPWFQPPSTYQPYAAMNYNTTPAFTTVSARRTLVPQPVMAQPVPAPNPPAKKVEWSPAVRDYVQRCFAVEHHIPGIERAEMETRLKAILTEAADSDRLRQIDWSTYPLPQQLILADRQVATHSPPNSSKKRKTDDVDMSEAADGSTPPWRKTAKANTFEDRISYANEAQATRLDKKTRKRQEALRAQNDSKYNADLEKRKQRFEAGKPGNLSMRPGASSRSESPNADAHAGPVVGTSQDIEKRYFRLTAPPKPETVRPLPVLEKTLDHLKKKWKAENNYTFICDQFKSLRQDLTVQHIKNEFTVNVYEIHARIALEKGDLGEYNQCQTQLRALYKQNLGGHPGEFMAYRILYFIHTCNRTGMNDVLADLTAADKKQPAVQHALNVRSALALGNYHRFFRLYLETPNMGGYLMDMFVSRERLAALANMCKAYKPDVRIMFLTEELGFESAQDCVQFLVDQNGQHLLLQNEDEVLRFATGKASQLFESARAEAFRRVDIKGQI